MTQIAQFSINNFGAQELQANVNSHGSVSIEYEHPIRETLRRTYPY